MIRYLSSRCYPKVVVSDDSEDEEEEEEEAELERQRRVQAADESLHSDTIPPMPRLVRTSHLATAAGRHLNRQELAFHLPPIASAAAMATSTSLLRSETAAAAANVRATTPKTTLRSESESEPPAEGFFQAQQRSSSELDCYNIDGTFIFDSKATSKGEAAAAAAAAAGHITEHAGAVASLLHSFRSRRAAILQSIDALARALNDPSSSSEEELNDGNGAADARVDGENAARIDADFDLDDRLKGRGSRFRSSRSRSSLARKAATNLEDWRAERVVQSALTRIAEFGLQLDMKSSITNEESSSSGDWNRGGSRQSKIDDVTPKPAQARLATLWLRAARQSLMLTFHRRNVTSWLAMLRARCADLTVLLDGVLTLERTCSVAFDDDTDDDGNGSSIDLDARNMKKKKKKKKKKKSTDSLRPMTAGGTRLESWWSDFCTAELFLLSSSSSSSSVASSTGKDDVRNSIAEGENRLSCDLFRTIMSRLFTYF